MLISIHIVSETKLTKFHYIDYVMQEIAEILAGSYEVWMYNII